MAEPDLPSSSPDQLDKGAFTAFLGHRRLAAGDLRVVAQAAARTDRPVLIFDDATGQVVDLDLRGSPEQAEAEYRARTAPPRAGRGRPRLGVVAREVTLLPRHWDWLAAQPGGASATLRRLVDDARREGADVDRTRQRRDALYRVLSALAGDLPGFEGASRALFAADRTAFAHLIADWPADVADYVQRLWPSD